MKRMLTAGAPRPDLVCGRRQKQQRERLSCPGPLGYTERIKPPSTRMFWPVM
jgi:hypothetical protein